jgi:hypothetical protein
MTRSGKLEPSTDPETGSRTGGHLGNGLVLTPICVNAPLLPRNRNRSVLIHQFAKINQLG